MGIEKELDDNVLEEYFKLQTLMFGCETHEEMFKIIEENMEVFDQVFAVLYDKIEKGEFRVCYQPHVQNGKCNGAEALFRITINDKNINPMVVFAMASYFGYERKLTGEVIKRILPDTVRFRDKISPDFRVSFNVNPQLFDKEFCEKLLKAIDAYNQEINSGREEKDKIDLRNNLAVELLETSSLKGVDPNNMRLLQENGLLIMLDDYGSGNAKQEALVLPFDVIKVDGKVIKDIQTNDIHKQLVVDLIEKYKDTNILVLAEHIDTKELEEFVTGLGVAKTQGNLYSEAIGCDEFLAKYSQKQKQDEIAD